MGTLNNESYSEERRVVTILFADIQKFTSLAETMDVEIVSDLLREVWEIVDEVIESHRGHIDKHIGDGVMAIFGAPYSREDDAEQAVSAGLALQAAMSEFNEKSQREGANELKIRVGINTGLVLAGYVGSKGEYTVIGDAVNIASRLEQHAEVGTVVIAESTFRMVKGAFQMRSISSIELKGKSEMVHAYLVEEKLKQPSAIRYRSFGGLQTRLVSREEELSFLESKFGQTLQQKIPSLVLVTGEAGIGKSRLLMEFSSNKEAEIEGIKLISGRALAQASKVPFFLWKSLWYNLFGINEDDSLEETRQKLLQGVRNLWDQDRDPSLFVEIAHHIGELIGLSLPESQYVISEELSPTDRLKNTFKLTRELLRRSAEKTPLILLLDDLQWADKGSLKLINFFLQPSEKPVQMLILGAARSELIKNNPELAKIADVLTLNPLRVDPDTLRYAYPDLKPFPDKILVEISLLAEGNPYFLEELVKCLLRSCLTEGTGLEQELSIPQKISLPPSLSVSLQARIDSLSPEGRGVLLLASVTGRVFWKGTILASLRIPSGTTQILKVSALNLDNQVDKALKELTVNELAFPAAHSVFRNEEQYIFKHSILRDVAYNLLPHKYRRQCHSAIAKWLSKIAGPDYYAMVSEHFIKAGDQKNANHYINLAIEHAQARGIKEELNV